MLIASLAYDSKYGYSTENFVQLLFIIEPITVCSHSQEVCQGGESV